MREEKKIIKAWITIPLDIEKWNIGSLIYSTKEEAEMQLQEKEKLQPCEISFISPKRVER
jgi:hypothetical protein